MLKYNINTGGPLYSQIQLSAVGRGPKIFFLHIKEINGSLVSKRAPSENRP